MLLLLSADDAFAEDNLLSATYTIKSDMQVLLPGGDVKAFGNVLITSGDMVIEAQEAVFHRKTGQIYLLLQRAHLSNIRVF
jgi:lipopolysaccharide export system protein LptA